MSPGLHLRKKLINKSNKFILISFTKKKEQSHNIENVIWLNKSLHWLYDYYYLGKYLKKNCEGCIIFQSAIESIFYHNKDKTIFIKLIFACSFIVGNQTKVSAPKIILKDISFDITFLPQFFFVSSNFNFLERVKGIEPLHPAWKASVLPLNYTRNAKPFNSLY